MPMPHIKNSQAGVNKYDAYFNSLFEVYFTLPEAIQSQFGQDVALITEHVQNIDGLDQLDKGPETVTQKFMGTTRTFVAPKMDSTSIDDLTVVLSLNLRNATDNYIYKIFKAWKNLNYNLETGSGSLKKDYCAEWMRIVITNRAGDIIRDVVIKDVILKGGIEGLGSLDYASTEPQQITVHFTSDWADDAVA